MNRPIFKGAAFASAFALLATSMSGCAGLPGLPGGSTGTSIPSNLAQAEAWIEAAAQQACSFLPTASTVADIIRANDPTLKTVESVASAICTAVGPAPAPVTTTALAFKTASPVYVDGVVIQGVWKAKKK